MSLSLSKLKSGEPIIVVVACVGPTISVEFASLLFKLDFTLRELNGGGGGRTANALLLRSHYRIK